MVRYLKTEIEFFQDILDGLKPFEVRFNDRNFKVGDVLVLQEYDSKRKIYTGREISKRVIYILDDPRFVKEGYVIMSLK